VNKIISQEKKGKIEKERTMEEEKREMFTSMIKIV